MHSEVQPHEPTRHLLRSCTCVPGEGVGAFSSRAGEDRNSTSLLWLGLPLPVDPIQDRFCDRFFSRFLEITAANLKTWFHATHNSFLRMLNSLRRLCFLLALRPGVRRGAGPEPQHGLRRNPCPCAQSVLLTLCSQNCLAQESTPAFSS